MYFTNDQDEFDEFSDVNENELEEFQLGKDSFDVETSFKCNKCGNIIDDLQYYTTDGPICVCGGYYKSADPFFDDDIFEV